MRIGGVAVMPFTKKLIKEFSADDIGGLAAELSYRYFLALFPFFIFLAALGGFIASAASIDDPTQKLMNQIGESLPADARSVLETQVRSVLEGHNGGLLSIGIIGAIWAASGSMKAVIKALNRAYDVPETRPFWKSMSLAVGMTVAATFGILGSFVLLIATQAFGRDIADAMNAGHQFELTVQILRWPAVILLVMTAVALLYWLAPNLDVPFHWISPGAVLFTVTWVVASIAFGLYVANFSSYNATYGTLGGVVVLLIWLYLTNLVFLIGAEVDALLAEEKEPELQRLRREAVASRASATAKKQAMEPAPVPRPGRPAKGGFGHR